MKKPVKKMTKKAPKRTKKKVAMAVEMPMNEHKSVSIKKASNGFVVSSYTDKGEKTLIAKNKKEAKKHADKLLGL
ncbi:MAG: hypothetical protein KAS04_02715 [Candidatus Aenigmarchaeota archaeon]|nr:hypothetical protein [Candidatus Aenigmarchaeota archaeon]